MSKLKRSFAMQHHRPLAARFGFILPLILPSAALTQQPASSLGPLRPKANFNPGDAAIVDQWIDGLIEAYLAVIAKAGEGDPGPNDVAMIKAKAYADFSQAFLDELNARDAGEPFKVFLVEQAAEKFAALFAQGRQLNVDLARTLAMTLVDINRVAARVALIAGLSFPDAEVRYHCAKAFVQLRSNIKVDNRLLQQIMRTLETAGKAEANPVVLKRIYTALLFTNDDKPLPESLAITLDILTTRIARWKGGMLVIDDGDVPAFALLKEHTNLLTPAQRDSLVSALAVLLRMDVQRYAQPPLPAAVKFTLGYRIWLTEDLLEALVGNGPNPDIREALLRDVAKDMVDRLDLWIGNAQKPGLLNAAPWNVPVGAP